MAMGMNIDISCIPRQTGVYLMKDRRERILYIGKALDLQSRVKQYIQQTDERPSVRLLCKDVARIDWIVTDNEKEAFLLENTLIKRHKPRWNIRLKDDKTYIHLLLNVQHPFPRLEIVRRPRKEGGLLFGPYPSVHSVRSTLRLLQRLFPLRTCSDLEFRHRTRPCLEYQIGRCLAPCVGAIDPEPYQRMVDSVVLFLKGKKGELLRGLRKRMRVAAEEERFEEAARCRDQIAAIEKTLETQKVSSHVSCDRDIFGFYTPSPFILSPLGRGEEGDPRGIPPPQRGGGDEEGAIVEVLTVREGELIGAKSYPLRPPLSAPFGELLSSFLNQYYSQDRSIPQEIVVPIDFEGRAVLASILSERVGGKVRVIAPKRGEKKRLLALANKNALHAYHQWREVGSDTDNLLAELQRRLHLKREPRVIEGYDISNIQGRLAVGSKVSFVDGKPAKDFYRHYTIQTVEGANDYAMMREVLLRRFKRGIQEGDLPDLILIDGGKGQLHLARAVLKEVGLLDVDLIGLAKAKGRSFEQRSSKGRVDRTVERIYLPGRKNPVVLKQNSPPLFLLQRVRDEAHRFAITHHQRLREKAMLLSPLDRVPGLGPRRKRALLQRFGSLEAIRGADIETLSQIRGISRALAEKIKKTEVTRGGDDPIK